MEPLLVWLAASRARVARFEAIATVVLVTLVAHAIWLPALAAALTRSPA